MPPATRRQSVHVIGFSLRLAAMREIDEVVIGTTGIFAGGSTSEHFSAVRIGFGIDIPPFDIFLFDEPALFERHALTPADVGKTFYEDETTDPNFAAVVSRLTNGADDLTFVRGFSLPFYG
jgi:hypothetical protein